MRILIVIALLLLLSGCGTTPQVHTPRVVSGPHIDRDLQQHLDTYGLTFYTAMQREFGDPIKAVHFAMQACNVRLNMRLENRWNLISTEAQRAKFCFPFVKQSAQLYIKTQEQMIDALTVDPDRLPKVKKPAPYYRERKYYENVNADVERMLAQLKEGMK